MYLLGGVSLQNDLNIRPVIINSGEQTNGYTLKLDLTKWNIRQQYGINKYNMCIVFSIPALSGDILFEPQNVTLTSDVTSTNTRFICSQILENEQTSNLYRDGSTIIGRVKPNYICIFDIDTYIKYDERGYIFTFTNTVSNSGIYLSKWTAIRVYTTLPNTFNISVPSQYSYKFLYYKIIKYF